MNWLDSMNAAIDDIEAHLREETDLAAAARIACCSPSAFQRMFAFAADITPGEYVRRRKMALAAAELTHTKNRIIDVAAAYGYNSPEGFARAFRACHGCSPSDVRKMGRYTDYPRISFQVQIAGGNCNMGAKPLVRIEEHGNGRVASFFVDCLGPEEAAWNLMRQWAFVSVTDCRARRYIGCAPKGHHPDGEAHEANEGPGYHPYTAQMFLLGDEGQDGMFRGAQVCAAPKGLFLVGDVALNEFDDSGNVDIGTSMMKAYAVMTECLNEMSGYEYELQSRPYYEEHIFPDEWFQGGDGLAGFKLWLPIRKI